MPGNEVSDKLHNFFEQDNSSQNPQSHVGVWPILNNSPWGGTRRHNGMPQTCNSKESSTQSLDIERENGRQSSQMPFGTNLHHFGLKPEFDKSHPRNQQSSFNGVMHGSQSSQATPKQAGFLEDCIVSDRHSSMLGGLANIGSQQGYVPDYSSGHNRNSERTDAAKVPVNFDFLSNQQQLMRSQHIGMSPHSRQLPGSSDLQLWQQHLMYKQLQEAHRQQQLQQLEQGARMQNSHGQLSSAAKQERVDQLPALLNGVPISNTSMHSWPNNVMGGESQTLLNPQKGIAGNLNWACSSGVPTVQDHSNGLMFQSDQGQAMRPVPVGFVTQQLDLSLHGAPVSSNRISSNHCSNLQGASPECPNEMTKAGGNQVEHAPLQSTPFNSFQSNQYIKQSSQDMMSDDTKSFQGKSSFGNASVQSLNTGGISGDFQQLNYLQQGSRPHEFKDRKEQAVWSGNLQEKAAGEVGPSCGMTSLDPTEEKLLFGTDDDNPWDASFGSWSALVEDAVLGSSHDKGVQEVLNCPPTMNHSDAFNNNLQNASLIPSKPSSLFNGADSSSKFLVGPNFEHSSTNFAYELNGRILADATQQYFQQSSEEAKTKQFDPSHKQKQFVECDLQGQMHKNDVYNAAHSSEMDFNSRNTQVFLTQRQNVPLCNVTSQHSSKRNGCSADESRAPSEDDTLEVSDRDNAKQCTHRNNTKRAIDAESNCDSTMWNSGGNHAKPPDLEAESDSVSPQIRTGVACMGNVDSVMDSNVLRARHEMDQQVLNRQPVNFGKPATFDSFMRTKIDESRRGQQTWDSSLNRTEKGSGKTSDSKQDHAKGFFNEDCTSNHSHHSQRTDNGDSERDTSLSTGSESHPFISLGEKASGQAGRQKVHRRVQHHPMGNLGPKVEEPLNTPSHTSYSQGLPHLVIGGYENREQGSDRPAQHAQFVDHAPSNNAMGMAKGKFTYSQRNIKEAEEIQSRGTSPARDSTASASFGGSTAQFSQNSRMGQTSQNMLQLLHKVNQSRHSNNAPRFGLLDHSTPSEMSEAAAPGRSETPHHNQSSPFQGFGLQLAPPSQWQQISKNIFPPQTSLHDLDTGQVEPRTGDKNQAKSVSAASAQSHPLPYETSRRESCENKSSGLTCKGTSNSSPQGNFLPIAASNFSYKGHQQQLQQHQQQCPSVDLPCGSQVEANTDVKPASLVRQAHDSQDRVVSGKDAQTSVSSVTGRIPPFGLTSSADNRGSPSQFYSSDTGPSQQMDAPKSSGQQLPVMKKEFVPTPSTAGTSQQASFSTMLHNVQANISAQQRLSGVQNSKLTPDILRSIIMSKNARGTTNSWALQKADDQGNNKRSASADIGKCSVDSQHFVDQEELDVKDNSLLQVPSEMVDATPKEGSTFQVQESVPDHHTNANSSAPMSSLRWHHQEIIEGKFGQDPSLKPSHTEQVPPSNDASSSRGIGLDKHTLEPSDAQVQNCSLLPQRPVRMDATSDSSWRVVAVRHKGAILGSDASQAECKTAPRSIYGQNTVMRLPLDGKLAETSHSSLPAEVRMLSFSSRKNEEISASTSSQLVGRELSSKDIHTSGHHGLQNDAHSLNTHRTSKFKGGSDLPQISPHAAPPGFEQHEVSEKCQILDMNDGQRGVEVSTQQYFFPKVSESVNNSTKEDKKTDTDQAVSLWQSTSSTTMLANESSPSHLPSDIVDHSAILRPKKRKTATSELLPWHKEVTQNPRRLQSISMAVLDWTHATNRLLEKVDDEAEMIEDSLSMSRSRRRLILSTQLMQQLLPSVPAAVLAAEAPYAYESVTYFISKAALGDACTMITYSGINSRAHLDSANTTREKRKTSEKARDHILSKAVEDSIGRSRKLEDDLFRLEKRANILELRMECQELERFSIINRLGKFHGRNPTDGFESSSHFGTAPRRTFPQRYVTALPMPANLPDSVFYLSL